MNQIRMTLPLLATVCLAPAVLIAQTQSPPSIGFNAQIRPILSEHCLACHGPDSSSRKASLRLDLRESALDVGVIVPGKPDASELIARILSEDPEEVMPPPSTGKKLQPEEKTLLRQWIAQGADWQAHWAFLKPVRPAVPTPDGTHGWSRNPIDFFIHSRLRELGLKPSRPADHYTLARRVALDLTGLPPTGDLLQEFLKDQTAESYQHLVNALLKSKHAGEHQARYWLDAARYGDTHGMHVDNYREIWPYRDWVVNAFNTGMPFDQFVIEQLAGDMLPGATLQQRIATGFNRCNITTSEGGAIPAELEVRYMVDRVETTATVFLGLTAGCAVCHDHKYDPLSQREFYQLGAIFNNSTAQVMDGNQKDTPPVITLPGDEFQDEWAALNLRRKKLIDDLSPDPSGLGQNPAAAAPAAAEGGSQPGKAPVELAARSWWPARKEHIEHPVDSEELLLWLPLTAATSSNLKLTASTRWAAEHPAGERGVRFDGNSEFQTPLQQLRSDEPLTISFWYRTPDRLLSTTLFNHTVQTKAKKTAGWKISSSTQGALTFELHDGAGGRIHGRLPGEEALTPRAWQHICVRYSGGQSNSSVTILVNGRKGILRNATELLIEAAQLPETPLKIASRMPTAGLSDIRIFRRWLTDREVPLLAQEFELRSLLAAQTDWDQIPPARQRLAGRFHAVTHRVKYRSMLRELARIERRRDFIYSRSNTTLVMQERSSKPRAWVLQRGEYDQQQAEVEAGIPAVLPPLPEGIAANRLTLARWLVHPDHPLTARVTVNRLWQSVFGVGLVRTSEDFGVMGERPSHPELLDWLAVEFISSGWDVNHMLRLIVNSATYRQHASVTPQLLQADPDNRYLARGPRVRLDAEVLRDQALAVSGLLVRTLGGPTVRPYQPAGLWKVVAITGSNTRIFEKDSGEALYRRSLYTFWKRTAPPPSMAAFNAPTREQCTVRRERTNTPIQALILLNDPQYVEAARHLAQNTILVHAVDRPRAVAMFRTVLRRPGTEPDIEDMLTLAAAMRTLFKTNPDSAAELIQTGDSRPEEKLDAVELAAWTIVANTLMNRDDFISK